MTKQVGFISANIHKSVDGTMVLNYTQWKNRKDFEKMLTNPRVIIHMNDVSSISKVDRRIFDVVFTEEQINDK